MDNYSYIYNEKVYKKAKMDEIVYLFIFVLSIIYTLAMNILLFIFTPKELTYILVMVPANFLFINLNILFFINFTLKSIRVNSHIKVLNDGYKNEYTYTFIKEDGTETIKDLVYTKLLFTNDNNESISLLVLEKYKVSLTNSKSYNVKVTDKYLYAYYEKEN